MLKTVKFSANKKTGPIAVTYRAGATNVYGTCPTSCPLNPRPQGGARALDAEYLDAVRHAVPRRGMAWTYSHFSPELLPVPRARETVVNFSADSIEDALQAKALGRAVVVTVAKGATWPRKVDGVRFVRCPAEVSDDVSCSSCGAGKPLCARGNRDFVVVFTAHGSQAAKVGTGDGGCYGAGGPVQLQWRATLASGTSDDGDAARRFARSLPSGSLLRHHIVGDMGVQS